MTINCRNLSKSCRNQERKSSYRCQNHRKTSRNVSRLANRLNAGILNCENMYVLYKRSHSRSSLCPPGLTRTFIKGKALPLRKNNFFPILVLKNARDFEIRLKNRGYPGSSVKRHLSELKFFNKKSMGRQM